MFIGNLVGHIRSAGEMDVHGRVQLGEQRVCPFGIISLKMSLSKTQVRSDATATRGAADQIAAENSVIMVSTSVDPELGDVFSYKGNAYRVVGVEPRITVSGQLHHYEVELETYLE